MDIDALRIGNWGVFLLSPPNSPAFDFPQRLPYSHGTMESVTSTRADTGHGDLSHNNMMGERLDRVERALGSPTWRMGSAIVYEGDCLSLMRQLDAGIFDLIVTSPPYNIGKEYEAPRRVSDYLAWCSDWLKEVSRVAAPHGGFWLNLGYLSVTDKAKCLPIAYLLWDKVPMYLLQEITWHYGAGVAAKRSFSPRNEKFLWYVKDKDRYTFNLDAVRDPNVKYPFQKKNGRLRCNPLGKNPGDVWHVPKVTSGMNRSSPERTAHPAQFPIAVIERIILACSNPGDVVLDPFMGSGTVAEAAARTGRSVVGFEILPRYVRIAEDRVTDYLLSEGRRRAQLALSVADTK
jgi:adenine-specific DNA-methyltransferase